MPLPPDPSVLQGVQLFEGLPIEALKTVLDHGRLRRLAANEVIFRQGAPAETCHLLVQGEVKIVQGTPGGQQVIVRFLGPREMYGTVAALMGAPMPADAVAVMDGVEVMWTLPVMDELMEAYPRIARNAVGLLGKRLLQAHRRIRELTIESVDRRIALTLARIARDTGKPMGEGLDIPFPLSRQDVAELTGTTLHTVSRLLSAWEKEGIVRSTRKHLVIADIDRLEALAKGSGGLSP